MTNTMVIGLGGEEGGEIFSHDSFLANLWLNNNHDLHEAMQGVLFSSTCEEAENRLASLVEDSINDGVITDSINLFAVDWKKIVFINSNDINNE